MARWGLPYQGSKNGIADWVVGNLPPSDCLVDLFAGGCAVTHCAMLSEKWSYFVANDITPYPQIFKDAIDGKFRDAEDVNRLVIVSEYTAPKNCVCVAKREKTALMNGKGTDGKVTEGLFVHEKHVAEYEQAVQVGKTAAMF
jgi:hypothetical protein